jgi:hypothetical protein
MPGLCGSNGFAFLEDHVEMLRITLKCWGSRWNVEDHVEMLRITLKCTVRAITSTLGDDVIREVIVSTSWDEEESARKGRETMLDWIRTDIFLAGVMHIDVVLGMEQSLSLLDSGVHLDS